MRSAPANPTGTTSLIGVMMGLAGTITPSTTGKLLIIISGSIQTTGGAGNGYQFQIRYGTGAAPANGAAITGTASGTLRNQLALNNNIPEAFSLNSIASGLTLATAYWIDISLAAIAGNTASVNDISISIVEV